MNLVHLQFLCDYVMFKIMTQTSILALLLNLLKKVFHKNKKYTDISVDLWDFSSNNLIFIGKPRSKIFWQMSTQKFYIHVYLIS